MLGKKEDLYYFQMINDEKIYCLLDFNIYLASMIIGMQIPASCIL